MYDKVPVYLLIAMLIICGVALVFQARHLLEKDEPTDRPINGVTEWMNLGNLCGLAREIHAASAGRLEDGRREALLTGALTVEDCLDHWKLTPAAQRLIPAMHETIDAYVGQRLH